MGFVLTESLNGSFSLNPYNFLHENISRIGAFVNDESHPGKPLRLKFAPESNYMEGLDSLYETAGEDSETTDIGINRMNYDRGYTLFGFKLLLVERDQHLPLIKQGNLKIEAIFGSPLTRNISLVIMAKFPSSIEIDNARNVIFSP